MTLHEANLPGAYVLEPELIEDERGFFARIFSADELAERGLEPAVTECSIAFNRVRWTLRGLHYQTPPHEETKIVRCTRGAVYDVIVDLRADSPAYGNWDAVELTAENRLALYIPAGCAHGYLTLEDEAELLYLISPGHMPEAAGGIRWNDPLLGIEWPALPRVISARDEAFPDLQAPGS